MKRKWSYDIKQSHTYPTLEKGNVIISETSSCWHVNWLDKCSVQSYSDLGQQHSLVEVKETVLTSAVSKQNTWTHKYLSFGSVYRQIIFTCTGVSKYKSKETLSPFIEQNTVLNFIINIQVNALNSVSLSRKSTKVCSSLEYHSSIPLSKPCPNNSISWQFTNSTYTQKLRQYVLFSWINTGLWWHHSRTSRQVSEICLDSLKLGTGSWEGFKSVHPIHSISTSEMQVTNAPHSGPLFFLP